MQKSKSFIYKLATLLLSVVCAGIFLFGCDSKEPQNTQKTITLDCEQIELTVGENKKIVATVSDNSQVEWLSADESIATVSDKGIVSGKSQGETTVTAKSGEASANCKVVVKAKAEEVVSKRTAFSGGIGVDALFVGDSVKIRPQLTIDGEVKNDVSVNFEISDTNVVSIVNNQLSALSVGSTSIKATCVYEGQNFTDTKTLEVAEYNGDDFAIVDLNGNIQKDVIILENTKEFSNQFAIRYYSQQGIQTCTLDYKNALANNVTAFDINNGSQVIGEMQVSLTNNNRTIIDQSGAVNAILFNGVSKKVNIQIVSVVINAKEFSVAETAFNAYVKETGVYSDFVEYVEDKTLTDAFSYDFVNAGGSMELDTKVTYNGAPSIKLTVPTNYSYFHLTDLVSNYQNYDLQVGSKVNFKICFDGDPVGAGIHYFAMGKITSKNGEPQYDGGNIIGYADADNYIAQYHGKTNKAWKDVTYVLDDQSFPLVDLGMQITGNHTSDHRYVYISYITIENPGEVNYADNFATMMEWDNTGANLPSDWWGYSLGVGNAFVNATPSRTILQKYAQAFSGSTVPKQMAVATPTMRKTATQSGITERIVLQNSSCAFNNTMKGLVYTGLNKIKIRVYMKASGTLPSNSSVTALVFLRNGNTESYGLSMDKLQTLQPNSWTELIYDVPSEYLSADKLTVAFNLKNYYQCNENVALEFYLGSISFINM